MRKNRSLIATLRGKDYKKINKNQTSSIIINYKSCSHTEIYCYGCELDIFRNLQIFEIPLTIPGMTTEEVLHTCTIMTQFQGKVMGRKEKKMYEKNCR